MNLWRRLVVARRGLSITTKFTLAFVTLLLLLGVVALTSYVSLGKVRSETEAAIVTSLDVQRRVFEMDAALRNARQLERDFFLRWSTKGFSLARQEYVEKHDEQIEKVLAISSNLQQQLTSQGVSVGLRQSNSDLVAYVEIVAQYSRNFNEAVGLVGNLGIENVGVLARLEQSAEKLSDSFNLADAPELMVLFLEMHSYEKEYLSNHSNSARELMSGAAQKLRNSIIPSSKLNSTARVQTLKNLDEYESVAGEIVELNEDILKKISSFDFDAKTVSDKLLTLAKAEVKRAQAAIARTTQAAKLLLIGTALVSLFLFGTVAKQFASALITLSRERMLSERLLLNILPEPIAQRLKQEEHTIADHFNEVTVMFADIVGFTELAAKTPPIELVEILNVIFSEFDQLANAHGLEKIKTIGDAYMVVGGLPEEKPNHAEAIAAMALDMQTAVTEFCKDTGKALSIRIGINTGPVIAGIIGTKKFIYDLWGDTVNIASRMESHGIPGHIQVTEATYNCLKSQYQFEKRGLIQVKGRGMMNCYLLEGRLGSG